MAKAKAGKGSTKSKKAPVEDELEAELEGLEEIDLDDEDEEDEDAPEVEEDDEDEEDDPYAGLTAAKLKAECKKRKIKGVDKKNKAALIALLVADDAEDDEEEDDEEEDDGPDFDAMSRSELKAHIKAEGLPVRVTKGMSDDDIRAAITGEDDDEEEEDDEPAPPKKGTKKGGTKSTGKKAKGKQPGQLVRELPNGRLSAQDVAEMAGGNTNALAVRNFLRSEAGARWPKNEELGRYAFTTKQAQQIVKAMKGRSRGGAKK